MIKQLFMVSVVAGILSGCTQQPPEPTPPPVARKAKPAEQAIPGPEAAAPAPPPPPGQVATPAVGTAAVEAKGPEIANPNVPFPGKDEAERLTWALRTYFQNPNRPAISSLDPLVTDGIIKSIPVAPPGKKYIIDMKQCEVRLVNK